MNDDDARSLGDAATFAGQAKPKRPRDDVSLGDERTLGGGDAAGLDTILDDIEVVDLLARYTIEGTLGQGGMGAVLLATDTRLDRKVAIKRILGEASRSKTAIMRFLTEAKAIAALNHPNIVQIYDYGRAKDGPFLIMEFVDGGSLADRCKQGAIPLEEAVELACQICDGLAKAHDAGIVHRDIKPANVLLNKDGLPKLTDFGLAKAEAADHGMTMTGAVMGTPDFMPPEQRRDAAEVDHRSDLWSLAASVYQMVTGRSPKIIRFNDVPTALQDVLAKALEDRKDARYQSAREFRDALKASVRAAAVAVEELVEGACPSCGVKNDSSRRFCRGCGESLEAPCLSCTKPMPMWEEICGSCGAKQTPLVDERRQAMAAKQAEAEGLLGDFEFDRATAIATLLRDEAHPKLKHLSGWATTLLAQIEKSRAEQTRQAVEAISEAGKHEAAHDYLSAAFALETIPETMRTAVLPGMREPAAGMLDRIKKTQAEVRRLEALVKERVAAKQLDELLPDVEKLIVLRPDREDIKKLRTQLLERQQKQAGARDKALEAAKASLAAYDYEGAVASLTSVAAAAVTPEVVKLREQAEGLVRQVRSLARKIKDAVTAKELDGLLPVAEEYLRLKPGDNDVVGLLQSLRAREKKITEEIASRLEQARKLEQACRFDEAKKILTAIPKPRRTQRVAACLGRASRLAPLRQEAMEMLTAAQSKGYKAAIESSGLYEITIADAGFTDVEFSALLAQVRAALADEEITRQTLRRLRLGAMALATVVALAAAGLWIRAYVRASALATAMQTEAWDAALAIEPDNVAALVGRARRKLHVAPPDIEGAFADLDRADRSSGSADATAAIRVDAHAVRARELARGGQLEAAMRDLATSDGGGGSPELLAIAREAIADGWTQKAKRELNEKNAAKARECCLAAKRHGAASPEFIQAFADSCKLLAQDALSGSDTTAAIGFLVEMGEASSSTFAATMSSATMTPLRDEVAASLQERFKTLGDERQYSRAITCLQSLGTVAPASFSRLLGELTSFPSDAILAIPPITNAVGMELKLLPAGRLMIADDPGDSPREAAIISCYYIGVHEVTNDQYQAVLGTKLQKEVFNYDNRGNWIHCSLAPNHPVECVNWFDANDFCRKLSEMPAELAAGRKYRLPTEVEWEYACRAGTTTSYSFGEFTEEDARGSGWGTATRGGVLGEYCWYARNSQESTHPVATRKPNPWGLYDMHGNVSEWCQDARGQGGKDRAIRGGGWESSETLCDSTGGNWTNPNNHLPDVGFRVVMVITATP